MQNIFVFSSFKRLFVLFDVKRSCVSVAWCVLHNTLHVQVVLEDTTFNYSGRPILSYIHKAHTNKVSHTKKSYTICRLLYFAYPAVSGWLRVCTPRRTPLPSPSSWRSGGGGRSRRLPRTPRGWRRGSSRRRLEKEKGVIVLASIFTYRSIAEIPHFPCLCTQSKDGTKAQSS